VSGVWHWACALYAISNCDTGGFEEIRWKHWSPLPIAWHLRGCCPLTGGPICCFFGQIVDAVGLWNLYGNNVYSVYGGGRVSDVSTAIAWVFILRPGLNPINLVPHESCDRLNLISCAFNQYAPGVPVARPTAAQNSPFSSPPVAITVVCTCCAYLRGMARVSLAWVAGSTARWFTCHKAVAHPATNRAKRRATLLIESNALPVHVVRNKPPPLTARRG